jgi:aryl-alcohol dehydrogenase-like predicted oxidoreductase
VLKWTILQPGITVALAGARNPQQVQHNAASVNIEISIEEMQFINSRLDELALRI